MGANQLLMRTKEKLQRSQSVEFQYDVCITYSEMAVVPP